MQWKAYNMLFLNAHLFVETMTCTVAVMLNEYWFAIHSSAPLASVPNVHLSHAQEHDKAQRLG
jgi:hypothetical protein